MREKECVREEGVCERGGSACERTECVREREMGRGEKGRERRREKEKERGGEREKEREREIDGTFMSIVFRLLRSSACCFQSAFVILGQRTKIM